MKYFLVIIGIATIFFSCGHNKLDVDVSKIKVELKIHRLDVDLLVTYPDTPDMKALKQKYANFFDLYTNMIIGIGDADKTNYLKLLTDFNKYCKNYDISTKVETKFGDLSHLKTDLSNAFKYYKYYFPQKKIPDIYTFLSGFRMSIVTDEGILGIGLDQYLGANCELYTAQGIDRYKARRMEPAMVTVDCMRAMATSEFPFPDSASNMLNQIVYEGKIQYFLDAVMPFEADTLKFGYTKDQFEWADYNEGKMWAHLIENQLLFSTDELTIKKMVGDAPFTTLFANNSAPRAGAFLGWKIIQNYMENNPGISLEKLMLNNDYQGILNAAEYKP